VETIDNGISGRESFLANPPDEDSVIVRLCMDLIRKRSSLAAACGRLILIKVTREVHKCHFSWNLSSPLIYLKT